MFILNLLRFLQGYVRFQAQGDFVERFLNLVARDRIPVWDSRKRGDTYTGCVRAKYYRRLRRHARKTGVRIRIADKEGAPFHRRKYRKRKGILAGLALFALFLLVMSSFIWRIEVSGNETTQESEIIAALDRIGIRPGVFRPSIDVRESENRALLQLQDLAWLALNIEGSVIHVEVYERRQPPVMIDPEEPCNIVAGYTGQILSMRVFDGQAVVQAGDTVMQGDVIISGITEDRRGQNLFRHALGEVMAQVDTTLQVQVPLQQSAYEETGEVVTRRYLALYTLDLPLFWPRAVSGPYRVARGERPLVVLGARLPLALLREEYVLMEQVPLTLSEEQARDQALRELAMVEAVRLDGAEILQRTLRAELRDGIFTLYADYTCILDIGVKRQILQNTDHTA